MTNEQKLVGIIDAIDVLAPVGEHLINTLRQPGETDQQVVERVRKTTPAAKRMTQESQ